jgi:sialate O-acetylesterase
VKAATLFTDNMMVQRDRPIRVWGLAEPDEGVTVSLAGRQATTRPDQDGCWSAELPTMKEGEDLELTVSGKNTITVKNVIVGDVWHVSGS